MSKKRILADILMLMPVAVGVNGANLVSENVFKDITMLPEVRNTRYLRPSPAGSLRKPGKTMAFYIGDSTMRTLTAGDGA